MIPISMARLFGEPPNLPRRPTSILSSSMQDDVHKVSVIGFKIIEGLFHYKVDHYWWKCTCGENSEQTFPEYIQAQNSGANHKNHSN